MFEVCADIGKNSRAGVEQETGSQMRKEGIQREQKRKNKDKGDFTQLVSGVCVLSCLCMFVYVWRELLLNFFIKYEI